MSAKMPWGHASPDYGCLAGGGEMGALMRSMDWSASPLGPIARWPQSLRTSVSTCLNSRFAILIWWGPDLIMLYNDAYREIIAGKHPAALGRPGRECWPEIWHIIGPMLRGVLEAGEATRSDDLLLLLERHGYPEECYFTFSYSPIRDESGGVGGVFTPVAETTDKVIGERRLRTLRDLASRGSVAKSPDQACRAAAETLLANRYDVPFAALYLYTPDRARATLAATAGIEAGSPISPESVSFDSGKPSLLAHAAERSRVEIIPGLPSLGRLPGGAWPVPPDSAIVLPLVSPGQNQPSGFLVAGISPRKRLDQSYRTFYDLAAGHIASAIAEAEAYQQERRRAEALAELDRAKTAFFSNVSHEFRTPLTLMLGPLESLLAGGSVPDSTRQELELIYRNALRLLKLVNNLLDFSRIEAGRIEARYEPVDLASFTADLASVFRSAIEKAGLALAIDCPPLPQLVYVDREMWEKIVLNLLSNAFKFTFQGEIGIALRQAGSQVELSVRDTGTGIEAGEIPHLFERFHRIQGAQGRTQEGSGIGLALVQELVRLHGGEVRVESVYGEGSVFTVSIPLGSAHLPRERVSGPGPQAAPTLAAGPYIEEALRSLPESAARTAAFSDRGWPALSLASGQREAPGDEPRPRILLADDNADMRLYLRRILQPQYEVEVVPDGQAALSAIARRRPDLVLCDVMMPRLDGFSLLASIRGSAETASLPVILLSARAGEEARVEGLQRGADDYLTKPFSARELLARVASHLAISGLRREAAERERELRFEADAERVRWRDLLRQAPAAIAVFRGPDHVFELVNEEYSRATGRREQDLLGKPIREALPEIAGQGLLELLDEVYSRGRPVAGNERLVRLDADADGTLEDRYFNFAYQPSRAADGSVEGILVLAVEVTEQVLARRRVEESENRFRTLADSMPQLAWMADETGAFLWANRRWYDYTGASAEETCRWREQPFHHPDHRERVVARWQEHLKAGRDWEDVFPLRGKDGQYRWFLSRAIALRDSTGRVTRWFGTNTDITEQRETEARLREAQKLESIGLLAGGIAHDFNNILVGVLGNASLVREMLPAGEAARLVKEIEKAAERAAHLTRQMLAYAGRAQFVIESIDLSRIVRETATLLRPSLSGRVALQFDLDPTPPTLEADAAEIQQVVMNLVLNAAEAIGDRPGTIAVKTWPEDFDERHLPDAIAVGVAEPGRYVCLEVRDTGCGMDENTKPRIFDPFFTTRFTGRGLGLAAVAGIVRSHKGAIRVESAVGQGSTFQVLFPAVPARAPESPAPAPLPEPTARGGTVLVVDDEEVVLQTARLVLERYGYSVVVASSGPAAIEAFERDPSGIDVVLLDLGMPGMDGRETLAALDRIHSGVKALVSSGYSEAETLRLFSGQKIAGFLQKPYRPEVLAGKIRAALRGD